MVSIDGRWRFSGDGLNPDRKFIVAAGVGGIEIKGMLLDAMGGPGTDPPRVLINNGATLATSIRYIGNHSTYDDNGATKTHPIKSVLGAGVSNSWYLHGNTFGSSVNRWFDSDGVSGTATIADAATSVAVVFDEAEPDANYRIEVQIVSKSGAAAAGSNRITELTSITASGFTINVEAAPGAGTSRTFSWRIYRYPVNT
jgi:hypothetical protein